MFFKFEDEKCSLGQDSMGRIKVSLLIQRVLSIQADLIAHLILSDVLIAIKKN